MQKVFVFIISFFSISNLFAQGLWNVSGGNVTTNTNSRVTIQNLTPNTTSVAEFTIERNVPMFNVMNGYIPQNYLNIVENVVTNGQQVPPASSTIFNINNQGYMGLGTAPASTFDLRFPTYNDFKVFNFKSKATERTFFYVNKLKQYSFSSLTQANDQGMFWSDGDSVKTEQVPILNEFGEPTGQMQTNYYYQNKTSGFVIAPYSSTHNGIRISSEGDVGIGTWQTFGAKLAVNGSIYCKDELIISNNNYAWPDYVFSNYFSGKKLQSLDSLKTEIKQLGHLPGLPSAEQVQANGIPTTEILIQLMKKVEELTLYTIEQQQEINRLKQASKSINETH